MSSRENIKLGQRQPAPREEHAISLNQSWTTFASPQLKGEALKVDVPGNLAPNTSAAKFFFNNIEAQLNSRRFHTLILIDPQEQAATKAWVKTARLIERYPAIIILGRNSSDLNLEDLLIRNLDRSARDFHLLDPRVHANLKELTSVKICLDKNLSPAKATNLAKKLHKSLRARMLPETATSQTNGFISIPTISELAAVLSAPEASLLRLSKGHNLLGFTIFFANPDFLPETLEPLAQNAAKQGESSNKCGFVYLTEVTPKGDAFGKIHSTSIYDAMGQQVVEIARAHGCQKLLAFCRIDPAPAVAMAAHRSRGWQRSSVFQEFKTPSGNPGLDELITFDLSQSWPSREDPLSPLPARKTPLAEEARTGVHWSISHSVIDEQLKNLLIELKAGTYLIGKSESAPELVMLRKGDNPEDFHIDYRAWNTEGTLVVTHSTIDSKRPNAREAVLMLTLARDYATRFWE